DAGLYYRLNPANKDGTAIIQRGKQFKSAYQYQNPKLNSSQHGHKGQEAFVQVGDITGVRDNSRTGGLELGADKIITLTAACKINGQNMGALGNEVNRWSAACWGAPVQRMRKIFDVAKVQINARLGDRFSLAMLHDNMF